MYRGFESHSLRIFLRKSERSRSDELGTPHEVGAQKRIPLPKIFINKLQILAIHVDRPYLRLALLKRRKKGPEIVSLQVVPIDGQMNVKRLYIHPNFKTISALPCKDCLIRPLEIKATQRKYLSKVIDFQSKTISHLSEEEATTAYIWHKKEKDTVQISFFVARRDQLRAAIEEMEEWGLAVDTMTALPIALWRYALWKAPQLMKGWVLHLGLSEWSCLWIEEGRLKKAHSLSRGTAHLMELFSGNEEAAKHLDLLQGEIPRLTQALSAMREELHRVLSTFGEGSCDLLFTGNVDVFLHLREWLMQGIESRVNKEISASIPIRELSFAGAIGMALEEGSLDRPPLQFRQGEFTPVHHWRRRGKAGLLLACAVAMANLVLFSLGNRWLKEREEEVLSSLMQSWVFTSPSLREEVFQEGTTLEECVDRWNRVLSKETESPAYFLPVPTATEAISWLLQHPLWTLEKPLSLQSLHYQLIETNEAKAKITLEFQADSSIHARKFHEALLKPNERVDPSSEIGWDVLPNSYRVSFFLKNRKGHA